jgi:hypothetical protein
MRHRAMCLTTEQCSLLCAMAGGSTLKVHRYLDGTKEYRLHPLDRAAEIVARGNVETLQEQGLIDSNKKFPAATFWLTAAGRARLDSSDPHQIPGE